MLKLAKTGQKLTKTKHRKQWEREKGWQLKTQFIAIKGGKCERCGGLFHPSVYDFHHRDPSKKKFNLSIDRLANRATDLIMKELEKCSLLCSNCHREVHLFNDLRFIEE